jgi:hypothetical protein
MKGPVQTHIWAKGQMKAHIEERPHQTHKLKEGPIKPIC